MRIIKPELDQFPTTLGADDLTKQMLLGFLINQYSSVEGQITGLRNNADNSTRQADALEAEKEKLKETLDALTIEVNEETEN